MSGESQEIMIISIVLVCKNDPNSIIALQIEAKIYGDYAIHPRYDMVGSDIVIDEDIYNVTHIDSGAHLCAFEKKSKTIAYVKAMTELVTKYGGALEPRDEGGFTRYKPDENFAKAHKEAKNIANGEKKIHA